MSRPHGTEVGAQLAELYKKGRDTLPEVANEIQNANFSANIMSSTTAFERDYRLGISRTGPGPELEAACEAFSDLLKSLQDTLDECGINIMKTAQDMARVDTETATAFKQGGGALE